MSDRSPDVYPARAPGAEVHPILPTAIDPDAMSVVRRLVSAGHSAYFVGGCVRDLLLGGTPKDFDIATSARPRQVKKLFRSARIIGRRFRLVHVIFPGNKQIEVSTFRRDPNADGTGALAGAGDAFTAHAGEAAGASGGDERGFDESLADVLGEESGASGRDHGGDARDDERDLDRGGDEEDEDLLIREDNVYGSEAEDAVRRDFTINGLFYDVEREEVIDWVGGVPDVRRRTLRTIGDASRRLREDPVRILRAVKFATRLNLGLDPLLAAAMADHHEELTKCAAPRVFEEILRILGGVAPDRAIEVLVGIGVFRVLFPEMPFEAHHADTDPHFRRLIARLRTMSAVDRGRRSLPTAIYLAILFWDELLLRMDGEAAPTEAAHHLPIQSLDDFLRPLGQRCRMAKRDTARVRAALLALRRIDPRFSDGGAKKRRRRGGLAEFVRREFFGDALLLMQITYAAEGLDPAPVHEWEAKRHELLGAPREEPHARHARNERLPRHHRADRPAPPASMSASPSTPPSAALPLAAPAPGKRTDDGSPLHRRRRRRRSRRHELFGAPADDRGEPA
ncbi:MAG: hypothetical protein FJ293_06770 [Planctomycetes bacterium]|nr:hypothetical protein [Planctomycetota bacterium]